MNLIELHILQSFPVTCLNRDDVGSPKSATFGGAQRARVSSQSLKRATRLLARDLAPSGFEGVRSRFLLEPFTTALISAGLDEAEAAKKAAALCEVFSKVDAKKPDQVTTAVYLSPGEIQQIATAVVAGEAPDKAVKKVDRLDAADIALFGRMIANDATLNVEGAAMFSHALSTHSTANEIDFFSAVDDRKGDSEDAGAGMIGTLEYNSATYYRYVGINLDLLFDTKHLKALGAAQRQSILRAFITAVLTAVPGARQNSMNGATLPIEVLGLRKNQGQPLQLINAFESPIKSKEGYASASSKAMLRHHADLKKLWGIESKDVLLTEAGFGGFLEQLLSGDV